MKYETRNDGNFTRARSSGNVHVGNYLTVSEEPDSPPTLENLTATGVRFPMEEKTFALQ